MEALSAAAFVSMSVSDVQAGAALVAGRPSAEIPARIAVVGPLLLVKTSVNAPVGFADLASDVAEMKHRCRIEVLTADQQQQEPQTIAIFVDEPLGESGAAGGDNDNTTSGRVTRKILFIRPMQCHTVGVWVDALRGAASRFSSSDANPENCGSSLFRLEIAAALSGLFRSAAVLPGDHDDNSRSLHFAFLNSSWHEAAKSAFDTAFKQHFALYQDGAVAMIRSAQARGEKALRMQAEHHEIVLSDANTTTAHVREQQIALQQQVDHLQAKLDRVMHGGSLPPHHDSSSHQQQDGASVSGGAGAGGGKSSAARGISSVSNSTPSRSLSQADAVADLIARFASQYNHFSEQADQLQNKFHAEARRMANVLAQKVHHDELLMQSAPALGASAEEHIRHRRTLEEAFKSLQILHSETTAELETNRKKIFELKSALNSAQESARHAIEAERERSQQALRNVQIEASDHMKHLAANLDTLRQDHAEELERMRASHEESMAILSKKLHISELKMLRAVEETEKAKFQLTQKSLEDHAKMAELKRKLAALELTIREQQKVVLDKDSTLEEKTDAAIRAVDRRAAAELARFKRLMIDRTLAGGGNTSPGGTAHNTNNTNNNNSCNVGGGSGGNTPRSAHNIGVGDTSAGHELYNSFRAGGSCTAGAHTQRAMRETSEAVMLLSPRSFGSRENLPYQSQEYHQDPSSSSTTAFLSRGAATGATSVPRLNITQAVRTPRGFEGFSGRNNNTTGNGNNNNGPATTSRYGDSPRSSARQGGSFAFDNPNAPHVAPVPESETYRKLAEISLRLKVGLTTLGAGSADETRRRVF